MHNKRDDSHSGEYSDKQSGQVVEEECGIQIGCGNCRSKRIPLPCCACGNNAKCFLFLLSVVVLFQGIAVNGLINIIISTIEKRFHLQSSETGFIAGCYDIGFLIAVPLVTYVGGRGHKPQWIGWGTFIMGLGSITFSLPHFIAPTYTIPDSVSYICAENASSNECGKSYLKVYWGFFIVGHMLHGIGGCGLFTLVVTYIDANVKKTKTGLYHGVYFACSVAGPGVGFIAGGALTRLYTNLGERVTIDEGSPYWIGNWWLGYLICGITFILLSMPITLFPTELSNTAKYRVDREREIHETAEAVKAKGDENFGKRFRDILRCLKVVLKNGTLVCISIAGAMDLGCLVVIATFGPKFMEAIHRLPPSEAGFYVGLGAIVSSITSHLLGGYIVSKYNPGIKTMIKFCIACGVLGLFCCFGFMIRCEDPDVPGVNLPSNGKSSYQCELTCGCGTELYDPVCGADGMTYLSLCDAGCNLAESGDMVNCTGVVNTDNNITLQQATATKGKCAFSDYCPPPGVQILFAAFLVFFSSLKFQPALQVTLRTVPFYQRSFAVGIQWVIVRCMGMIPLPLIFGRLLDNACLVWEHICGNCGSCRLYNNSVMSNSLTILLVCSKCIAILALLIALFVYKPPSSEESDLVLEKSDELKSSEEKLRNTDKGKSHLNNAYVNE